MTVMVRMPGARKCRNGTPITSPRLGPMASAKTARNSPAVTSGGTEMHAAVIEALCTLRDDAQRQIVLVTDGYIGFEAQVVGEVMERLPAGTRLHTVGIGIGVCRHPLPVRREVQMSHRAHAIR